MQFTNKQAHTYALKHAIAAVEVARIYEAVLYGETLKGIERKAVGDPLEKAAFDYASKFVDQTNEERFRIHQAVFYGTKLLPEQPESAVLTDHSLMPFGKFKDKQMINVPAFYLLWLYNEGCSHTGVKKYIIDNLDSLRKEAGQKQRS